MRVIIDAGNIRRDINVPFSIYGRRDALVAIRDALNTAINAGVDPGWAKVTGDTPAPDKAVFPYDKTSEEKQVYPWVKE